MWHGPTTAETSMTVVWQTASERAVKGRQRTCWCDIVGFKCKTQQTPPELETTNKSTCGNYYWKTLKRSADTSATGSLITTCWFNLLFAVNYQVSFTDLHILPTPKCLYLISIYKCVRASCHHFLLIPLASVLLCRVQRQFAKKINVSFG